SNHTSRTSTYPLSLHDALPIFKHNDAGILVNGITVSRPKSEGQQRIAMLVHDAAEFLDIDILLAPEDIVIDDGYIGAGYAIITPDRKSTRLNSSHQIISYAVFC